MHARPAGSQEGICLPRCTRAQLHRGEWLMCSTFLTTSSRHHLHGKCQEVHIRMVPLQVLPGEAIVSAVGLSKTHDQM